VHVAIDPERFRHAVKSAVYVKFKTWRKGASLLRVTLADGRVQDLAVPMGQSAIDPAPEGGSWIFEPDAGQEFDELTAAAWQVVFPERLRRAEARHRRASPDAGSSSLPAMPR